MKLFYLQCFSVAYHKQRTIENSFLEERGENQNFNHSNMCFLYSHVIFVAPNLGNWDKQWHRNDGKQWSLAFGHGKIRTTCTYFWGNWGEWWHWNDDHFDFGYTRKRATSQCEGQNFVAIRKLFCIVLNPEKSLFCDHRRWNPSNLKKTS